MFFKKIVTHKNIHQDEAWIFWLVSLMKWKFGEIVEVYSNEKIEKEERVLYVGIPEHGITTCSLRKFVKQFSEEIGKVIDLKIFESIMKVVLPEDTGGKLFSSRPPRGLIPMSFHKLLVYLNCISTPLEKLLETIQPICELIYRGAEELLLREPRKVDLAEFLFSSYSKFTANLEVLSSDGQFSSELKWIGQYLSNLRKQKQKRVKNPELLLTLPGIVYSALLDEKTELAEKICKLFFETALWGEREHEIAEKDAEKRVKRIVDRLIILQFNSDSHRASHVARKYDAGVSIIKRSNGSVQISSGRSKVSLQKVAGILRRREAEIRELEIEELAGIFGSDCLWFLHESQTLLMNGSDTSRVEPTMISEEEILSLVCEGLKKN